MSAEKIAEQFDQEFEKLLSHKDRRLSSGTRKYIRGLKSEDRISHAYQVRREAIESRWDKDLQAFLKLDESVSNLLSTRDPKVELKEAIRSIWLLNVIGEIPDTDTRNAEIDQVLSKAEEKMNGYVDEILPQIRDEMSPLLKGR